MASTEARESMEEHNYLRKKRQGRRKKGRRAEGNNRKNSTLTGKTKSRPPHWIGSVPQDFQPSSKSVVSEFPRRVGSDHLKHVDFFCIVDFEATCGVPALEREIIEFPAVLLDVREGPQKAVVVSEFQRFCKPVAHPMLQPVCTELTGITKESVDKGIPFHQALMEHSVWLACRLNADGEPKGQPTYTAVIVTCGDWDMGTCLPNQLELIGMSSDGVPSVYNRWINIKSTYAQLPPFKKGKSMKQMLAREGLPLAGHHHSGIDDSRNICNLLAYLIRSGAIPENDIIQRESDAK